MSTNLAELNRRTVEIVEFATGARKLVRSGYMCPRYRELLIAIGREVFEVAADIAVTPLAQEKRFEFARNLAYAAAEIAALLVMPDSEHALVPRQELGGMTAAEKIMELRSALSDQKAHARHLRAR